jgi:hypothetical protein
MVTALSLLKSNKVHTNATRNRFPKQHWIYICYLKLSAFCTELEPLDMPHIYSAGIQATTYFP